jgi:SAM-dependent methyltransferase
MSRNSFLYRLYRRSRVLPVIYWECKGRVLRLASRYRGKKFDKLYDIETEDGLGPFNLGYAPDIASHSSAYNPVDLIRFEQIMAQLAVDPEAFCFIDIGSGKGRALFLAEQYGFRRIFGVELSTKVHQVAEGNLKRYRTKVGQEPRIALHNCSALEFALPDQPTVIFMYNPFDAVIMSQFAAKLDSSLMQNPRPLYLIYVHPVAETALGQSKCIRKIFEDRRHDFLIYSGPSE